MISRASSFVSLTDSNASTKDGIPSIQGQPEQKPAKKLPENAALMNPIMLLNQMHPSAKYEELGKTGAPPHIQFTIKCIVGNQSFVGTGPNKKAARKQATFEACKTLLGIQYPPDILQGTSNKEAPMETS
ncbi:Double-stranded RNA binding motif [Popillia japonica]|uniref:Double-stranded RNA binding motif n=1 Tax=Popillia japonica TaxID=7064 RepID=A0AAW1LUK9_POPJA